MLFTALRLFFTLQHTTSTDALATAFAPDFYSDDHAPARPAPRGISAIYNTIPLAGQDSALWTMSQPALARWLDRCQGFAESPVKRPIEMSVDIRSGPSGGGLTRMVRCHRRFTGQPTEIVRVMRCHDLLFQDNEVSGWQTHADDGEPWDTADLEGATLRLRAAFLSFDDVNFRHPPRLWNLHLYLGGASPVVLFFTPEQLEAPRISEDPSPLLRSRFFKTLLVDYQLPLTAGLLARQLRPLRQLHV